MLEDDFTLKINARLHNRSSDPSYQNTLFTSYADECRARKKLLEIKIAQISRFIEYTKNEIEIQEKQSPSTPEVFNIFDPVPSFEKVHVIMDCTRQLDSSSSFLLTPSCHEPIHPQFLLANKQKDQNQNMNDFIHNFDSKKILCNITKVSDPDGANEAYIKPKPTESRKSIHMKMELIERCARLQKIYPQLYLKTEERDEIFSARKKQFNESAFDFAHHETKKIVPLFWPSRPGDEKYRLPLEENDDLYAKILDLIKAQSYENTSFRYVPINKKKKRDFQKLKIPVVDSSTEFSSQETEPDDFFI